VNNGGDMGWVSRHMLSSDLEDAIFQAPVGGLSRMVTTSDGLYLFKVLAEETRTPDAATQLKLKSSVFDKWLSDLTAATNIWTDSAGLTAITPAAS
jgi:parvulin-like peptidyl-prolyl isomerase